MYNQERQDQLRKLWKLHSKHCDRAVRRFCKASGLDVKEVEAEPWMYDDLRFPPLPRELSELTCGAKTRKGTPCKNKSIYRSGRCKFHGGLSTGPTSEEGKRRCAENGKITARRKAEEVDPMNGQ